MKYAFVIGSSAFIVPHGVIHYADQDRTKQILRINSIYHDTQPESHLSIELQIKDNGGNDVLVSDNKLQTVSKYNLIETRNSIKLVTPGGELLIEVHQLDAEAAMGLEHNITAEFEVNMPLVVIRINGDFMVEGVHVIGENEKLYVNNDGYATSALAGDDLRFTPVGLML